MEYAQWNYFCTVTWELRKTKSRKDLQIVYWSGLHECILEVVFLRLRYFTQYFYMNVYLVAICIRNSWSGTTVKVFPVCICSFTAVWTTTNKEASKALSSWICVVVERSRGRGHRLRTVIDILALARFWPNAGIILAEICPGGYRLVCLTI